MVHGHGVNVFSPPAEPRFFKLHHRLGEGGVLAQALCGGGLRLHLLVSIGLEARHRLAHTAKEATRPRDGARHRGLIAGRRGAAHVGVEDLSRGHDLAAKLLEDVVELILHLAVNGALTLDALEALQQLERPLGAAQLLERRVDEHPRGPFNLLLVSLELGVDSGPLRHELLVEHVKLDRLHWVSHSGDSRDDLIDALSVAGYSLELRTEKFMEAVHHLKHVAQVGADAGHVVGAAKQSLAVELPSRIPSRDLDLLAHRQVRGSPRFEHVLGQLNLGQGEGRGEAEDDANVDLFTHLIPNLAGNAFHEAPHAGIVVVMLRDDPHHTQGVEHRREGIHHRG
mmetsp:Transcript_30425/g.76171  ORF Transcript_30425/g.76171 Transcript_30425/m.76171 type:complete len:340 (+) Transcript_30425:3609-4628(+)